MERCVKKIRDFIDISLLAGNINIRNPRNLILKSANLDNTLNLDITDLAERHLISRMLKNLIIFYYCDIEDVLSLRGDKEDTPLGILICTR